MIMQSPRSESCISVKVYLLPKPEVTLNSNFWWGEGGLERRSKLTCIFIKTGCRDYVLQGSFFLTNSLTTEP